MKKTTEKPFNFFKSIETSYQGTRHKTQRPFPKIDMKSAFYKNFKRNRKVEAKICQVCPFREGIEEQENA